MGRIVISENVSLDGVGQDPNGDEGFERGGWFAATAEGDREAWAKRALDEVLEADALLLGRRGYEWFAARWPSRSGAFAERLNAMPKYVVSSTLTDPAWTNSTVLRGDLAAAVSELKREHPGDIVVYASFELVRALLEHNLADEVRLVIYPVVLGAGRRVFDSTSAMHSMRLTDSGVVGDGLIRLRYELIQVHGSENHEAR